MKSGTDFHEKFPLVAGALVVLYLGLFLLIDLHQCFDSPDPKREPLNKSHLTVRQISLKICEWFSDNRSILEKKYDQI